MDHFRRDPGLINPRSFAPLWPTLLWLAACLFLGDVAVRRIAPDTDRIKVALANGWNRLRGQQAVPVSDYMDKLRSRKAEVGEQLERSRFASRFQAPEGAEPATGEATAAGAAILSGGQPGGRPPAPPAAGKKGPSAGLAPDAPKPEETSYTNRLLKAKQKVWEEREKDKDKREPRA